MVCLRNMCMDTLHKVDNSDDDNNNKPCVVGHNPPTYKASPVVNDRTNTG
jgi:hypothetical protein